MISSLRVWTECRGLDQTTLYPYPSISACVCDGNKNKHIHTNHCCVSSKVNFPHPRKGDSKEFPVQASDRLHSYVALIQENQHYYYILLYPAYIYIQLHYYFYYHLHSTKKIYKISPDRSAVINLSFA